MVCLVPETWNIHIEWWFMCHVSCAIFSYISVVLRSADSQESLHGAAHHKKDWAAHGYSEIIHEFWDGRAPPRVCWIMHYTQIRNIGHAAWRLKQVQKNSNSIYETFLLNPNRVIISFQNILKTWMEYGEYFQWRTRSRNRNITTCDKLRIIV